MTYNGLDEDRRYITRSAEELPQYLSSDVLLWRMTEINIPLCPGNILLALRKLSAVPGSNEAQSLGAVKELIEKRRIVWETKVSREIPMRVNQWRELVEDYHRNTAIDASYRYNVRVRIILHLLLNESRYLDHELQEKIESADELLRLLVKPGEFVWDTDLIPVFPQELHPYLYFEQAGR